MMLSRVCNSITHLMRTDESTRDVQEFLNESILECLVLLDTPFEDVILELSDSFCFVASNNSDLVWKVVCTGCYLLSKLVECLENEPEALLSVAQNTNIKKLMQFIVSNGIHPSLLPGVGITTVKYNDLKLKLDDFEKYKRLKAVCNFMNNIFKNEELGMILIINFFSDYLAALHQLCFAPIVKPNSVITVDSKPFTITQELWNDLQTDQKQFKAVLNSAITKSNQQIIIKELIVLQGVKNNKLPNFMKRSLGKELSECLTASKGLQSLIKCFVDSPKIDVGTQWAHVDMIVRLVSVKHGTVSDDEYLKNICNQLRDIMQTSPNDSQIVITSACTASLMENFEKNEHIRALINEILSPFIMPSENLNTVTIHNGIHKLDLCFNYPKLSLPVDLLSEIVYCLFSLRVILPHSSELCLKLDNLICKHLTSVSADEKDWINAMIFGEKHHKVSVNRTIQFEIIDNEIKINRNADFVKENIGQRIATLVEILDNNPAAQKFTYKLFLFLLNYFVESNYLTECKTYEENGKSETMLFVTKGLEVLASKKCVLESLKNNPEEMTEFIKKILNQYSTNKEDHKKVSNNHETLTISLVLLSTLLSDSSFDKRYLLDMVDPLKSIMKQSLGIGIQYLCKEILNLLTSNSTKEHKVNSKFDQAVDQICDPLLPVRAHGLIELTKLLEDGDTETLSKKELVQCIFQENLKDADSYVYLSAIKGLSNLCKHSPDDVLEILSKEYLNEANSKMFTLDAEDENLKLRMKIGEILLKATKNLGEKAVDYKAILLNTFLGGCHDTDIFMRASSLSNLAELCEILSYKLGDILFDILKSVDNIILYDKSIECRRAAVLVISKLIKGLGKESLFFLRDALLPMYRTLKKLYSDEKEDPAVRLHAQVALEELNDIMREIMAPYLKHTSNK